jgi:hypothetical protein
VDEETRRSVAEAREHAAECEAGAEAQELPPALEQRLLDVFREWRDA